MQLAQPHDLGIIRVWGHEDASGDLVRIPCLLEMGKFTKINPPDNVPNLLTCLFSYSFLKLLFNPSTVYSNLSWKDWQGPGGLRALPSQSPHLPAPPSLFFSSIFLTLSQPPPSFSGPWSLSLSSGLYSPVAP